MGNCCVEWGDCCVEWATVAVSRAMESVVGDVPLAVRVEMLPAICTGWGEGGGGGGVAAWLQEGGQRRLMTILCDADLGRDGRQLELRHGMLTEPGSLCLVTSSPPCLGIVLTRRPRHRPSPESLPVFA